MTVSGTCFINQSSPVMTISKNGIRLFEGIKYVLPILHPNKKRLALIMCPEEDSASVEWARQKGENWVNKDITFRGDIKEFGGKKVVKLLDYAPGLDGLPKSDVLKFLLEDAHQDARYNPMSDGVHERKEWIYWMIPCF